MNENARFRCFHLALAATVAAALAAAPDLARAHDHSGYSSDALIGTTNSDWMAAIRPEVRINELSIPGTHDTMSRTYQGLPIENFSVIDDVAALQVITQTSSLSDQLHSGIRALDIRVWHRGRIPSDGEASIGDDVFELTHGAERQFTLFGDDVLAVCETFLTAHPGETLFMRIQDQAGGGMNAGTTRPVYETFEAYRNQYQGIIWSPGPADSDNPTLGEVRGKIIIMPDFSQYLADYGIDWPDTPTNTPLGNTSVTLPGGQVVWIQDSFQLTSQADLYGKWLAVKDHLNRARTGSGNDLFINFLSGAWVPGANTPVFPFFVASGHLTPDTDGSRVWTGLTTITHPNTYPDFPRTGCVSIPLLPDICDISYEGTNVLTTSLLDNWYVFSLIFGDNSFATPRLGLVFADYPGPGFVNAIIRTNNNLVATVVKNTNNTGADSMSDLIARGETLILFDPAVFTGPLHIIPLTDDIILPPPGNPITIDATTIPGKIQLFNFAPQPVRIGNAP